MMGDRLNAARPLISADGHLLCHIDENEYERLKILLDSIGIPDAGTVVWDKRNPMTARRGIATQHEYIVWRSATEKSIYQGSTNILEILRAAERIIARHGGVTDVARREYSEWVRKNHRLSGGEKAYSYLDDKGCIYRCVSLRAPEPRTDPKFFEPLVHPVTGKPCAVPPNGFSRTPETLRAMMERGEIIFGPDESTQPQQKRLLTEESRMQVSSVIQDAKKGKEDLDALGLDFPYCHPVSLYEKLVSAAASSSSAIILDFFAGSGTTAHAVIKLNREDGGRRKFILVDMADYFDSVLVPRIKKVMFTPEWKDGRPERLATKEEAERTPRLVKVLRLESYEDALHNTFSDQAIERLAERERAYREAVGDEEYRIRYMVKLPLEASDSMLNLAKLEHPFDYTLEVLTDHGPRTETVDLVETFNWLYGLRVHRLFTWVNDKDKAGKEKEGRTCRVVVASDRENKKRVLVVWRDMTDLNPAVERQFLEDKAKELGPFEERWINGDSAAKGFASLDGLFKRLMEAEAR
jgi:adenine-specific DNA-methyltransferase